MSQQSLTSLSKAANYLYHPKEAEGINITSSSTSNSTAFSFPVGTQGLKIRTFESISRIAEANKENDFILDADRTIHSGKPGAAGGTVSTLASTTNSSTTITVSSEKNNLRDYHYRTSFEAGELRRRMGALDIPPKPIGSIPGYTGFIPRKESANVIGEGYKSGNLRIAQLFADEQAVARKLLQNIKKPDSELCTPDTSELHSNPGELEKILGSGA